MKGLVPFWVDVVVYVLGPLSALWGRWDEQLHIWIWGVHCAHTFTSVNEKQNPKVKVL